MTKPSYLLIGAQKCATSWLFNCLREHPHIFAPERKRDSFPLGRACYSKGRESEYFQAFEAAGYNQIIVDGSVDYLYYYSDCCPAITEYIPDTRFIAVLRDPVARAVSAYSWNTRAGLIPPDPLNDGLRKAMEIADKGADPGSAEELIYQCIIERGFYVKQLKAYFDYFPSERFMVIFYDDIVQSPVHVLSEVFKFVGAEPHFTPKSLYARPKTRLGPTASAFQTFVARKTKNRFLKKGLCKTLEFLSRGKVKENKQAKDLLNPEIRSELYQRYSQATLGLQTLLQDSNIRPVTSLTLSQVDHLWQSKALDEAEQ